MGQSKTSATKVKAAERELEILNLRKEGMTYREIADQLGCSHQNVWKIAQRAFDKLRKQGSEAAEEILSLNLERLDDLLKGYLEKANGGDTDAVRVVFGVMDRQGKWLGLDAPRKSEIVFSNMSDTELLEEARRLGIATQENA